MRKVVEELVERVMSCILGQQFFRLGSSNKETLLDELISASDDINLFVDDIANLASDASSFVFMYSV